MAMVYNSLFTSNTIYLPSPNPNNKLFSHNNFTPKTKTKTKTKTKNLKLLKAVSIPHQPINVDYLETEFSGHGASFTRLGESCVVRMGLENGSAATLMLPSGLITSYKAPMWHGGLLELLHTSVSEGDGGAVIRGGVSVALKFEGSGVLWCPGVWDLRNVGGSPDESIQVELISSNQEEKIEIKHIVTLQQDAISSEIVITNLRSSSLQMMGSIIGHLAISTPEAAYAVGLESSNFFIKPPVYSNFSIIPPDFNKNDSGSRNPWSQLLSGWGLSPNDGLNDETVKNGEENEEIEGEEEDNYKHLTEKMSLIYTSAPRSFTIMDRGKRNSIVVSREGFDELYILSPGSTHKPYGKYAYLCIGQAALLKPITIGAESEWRGGDGMASSQPSKKAVKSPSGNSGVSSSQAVKFARRTSSGRYVGLSKDDVETSGETSEDYTNYTVHIPATSEANDASVATKAEEQYVSSSLFTGGFNSVTRAHMMDKVIDSEVTHPQMAGSKGSSCAMPACDGKAMKDERGVDIDPCECRFKICRDCFLDAQNDTGLCPGCKEPYKINDGDDESPSSTGTLSLPGADGKRTSLTKKNQNGEFDQNKWLFNETSGTYGVGNAYWPSDGSGGDGKSGGGLGDPADKPWRPLTRRIPIPNNIISPYRLLIVVRLIVLCFFLTWRVTHPNNDAMWLWFMSIVCEIWFAFSWILDQVPKLCPINRSVDLQLLHHKFESQDKVINPNGRSDLPGVDFFVSTADPEKEPVLVTANTILSILAVEYPVEKIACYVSDDGGALLTFEAMAEACSFADLWVPFCRKHDIEPRNPDTYFSLKGDPTKNKKRLDFVKDRRRVKREYDEFKVRINNLPDSIRRRSDAFNAREEMKVIKSIRESGVDPTEPIKVKRATWMADGTHWPGTWTNPSRDHAKGDHAGILQVMLKPPSPNPLYGLADDGLVDYSDVDIRLPMFVYMSREKRSGYDHNKKAGAMNALVRSSAVLSNGPFILNLDCDHYVYNCMAVREGICFMMDRGGEDICYIQFPQRFEGIDPSDRYANHNTVFFDGNMRALDGVQGPFYVGTGCMFRRFALYGFDPPKLDMILHEQKGADGNTASAETQALKATDFDPDLDVNELPRRFGNSTLLSNSIPVAEFQGRPIADHPAVKYGRPPGVLRNAREPLDAKTVAEAVSVISCWYEDKTEWGDRVGWIYGSVTEDVLSGYRMHNRGWRSIYCLTKRDAFRGSAPINLTDRLHQVLRWATGSVEIFFSRNNAFLASKRLKLLQRLAYLNVGIYPFTSLFLIVYCFLPALSLFSGHFIVKNINVTFLVYLLVMTLCLIGLAVLEVRWSEVSLEDWWRNEQFWLISGTSSHFAAVIQGLLKVIAGIEISFTLTSKSVEDGDDAYAELYLVKWTSLMIPPIVIAMINALAMVVAFSRTIYSINPQWGKFVGGAFFSFWVLAHLYPFFKGLMGRRRKTPTIVFVWSGLIAITLSLLWVAINPNTGPSDAGAGGSSFQFP